MANRTRPTEEQQKEMAVAYSSGRTLQSIAADFNVSVPTVSKYVKAAGVTVKGKGRRGTVDNTSTTARTSISTNTESLFDLGQETSDTFDF